MSDETNSPFIHQNSIKSIVPHIEFIRRPNVSRSLLQRERAFDKWNTYFLSKRQTFSLCFLCYINELTDTTSCCALFVRVNYYFSFLLSTLTSFFWGRRAEWHSNRLWTRGLWFRFSVAAINSIFIFSFFSFYKTFLILYRMKA